MSQTTAVQLITDGPSFTIQATGIYKLQNLIPESGNKTAEVSVQLLTAGTCTCNLEFVDGTPIADTMTLSDTSLHMVTTGATGQTIPALITMSGPRFVNVTALSAGAQLVVTVYA